MSDLPGYDAWKTATPPEYEELDPAEPREWFEKGEADFNAGKCEPPSERDLPGRADWYDSGWKFAQDGDALDREA